jgi:hypothetical protein
VTPHGPTPGKSLGQGIDLVVVTPRESKKFGREIRSRLIAQSDLFAGGSVRLPADRRSPIDSCRQGPGSSRGMANSFFCFSIRFLFFVYSFSFILFAFTERGHDLERGCDGEQTR